MADMSKDPLKDLMEKGNITPYQGPKIDVYGALQPAANAIFDTVANQAKKVGQAWDMEAPAAPPSPKGMPQSPAVNSGALDLMNQTIKTASPNTFSGKAENTTGTNEITVTENPEFGSGGIGVEGGNPYDKLFQGLASQIESLAGGVRPASSGMLSDTFNENYAAITKMKNLRGLAEMVAPLTTAGMKMPVYEMTAKNRLDPSQVAENIAHADLLKKQSAYFAPKPELEEKKEAYATHERQSKMVEALITANPKMKIQDAWKQARETHVMPERAGGRTTDKKGVVTVPYIDGSVRYFDEKSGLEIIPKGVPGKK